jgi:HEAT repeat protein
MAGRKQMILCGLFILPAAARAQAPEASKEDPARIKRFREAMEVIETSTEASALVKAMEALREGYPSSRAVLVEAIEKGSVKKKTFAIHVLGEYGKAEDDMPVIVPALKHSREKVRLAAVMAIRRLGNTGLKAILDYLPGESVANNRKMAVKTLQHWKDPSACPQLIRMLKTESEEDVQRFIVTALEQITGKKLGNSPAAWEDYIDSQAARKHVETFRAKSVKEASGK